MAKITAKPPILVAFGHLVRKHRKAKGFSQEAFADVCEIDRSYMGGVERGERNLALVNIERIVAALELKPSIFFKELDEHWLQQVQSPQKPTK
jgi:transcriptional regulator with XRE-family HTH domain